MPAVTTRLNDFILPATRPAARPAGPSLWVRLRDAVLAAEQRRTERDIALLIEQRGGRITDDVERQIQRHFV